MGWQREVREILDRADWPPRPATVAGTPWLKVVLLALAGWALAELLSRIEESARARAGQAAAYR
jgi:hypothetical protein